jgi:hypothetical protein
MSRFLAYIHGVCSLAGVSFALYLDGRFEYVGAFNLDKYDRSIAFSS